VVDDHSTDGTAEVAESHGARVIRHPENRGAAASRNTGIFATTSDWVAFLDSDDEWLPHHLAHMWELRAKHALVGTSVLSCFDDPRRDRFHGAVRRQPVVLKSPDSLIVYNMFAASASMIKREIAVSLGGFHPHWGVEDFDLWVRVLEHYSAICSPRVTVLYHAHDQQLSLDYTRMHRGHRQVAEAHLQRTGAASTALERWEGVAAWDAMRAALAAGDWAVALRHIPGFSRSPERLFGLMLLLWTRFLTRRRSAEVGRDGAPSVALLVREPRTRRKLMQTLEGRATRDLSQLSITRAIATLIRRPAGVIVSDSEAEVALMRATGMPVVTAAQVVDGTSAAAGAASRWASR
jgi:hypothetical protein